MARPNPEHVDRLLRSIDEWNAWVAALPLGEDPDLANADLKGRDLSGADLRRVDSYWALGADLRNANLSGINLAQARLSDTDLRGADLTGVRFAKWGSLRGAFYDDTTVFPAGFDQERFGLVPITEFYERYPAKQSELAEGSLYGARLDGANLSKEKLRDLELGGRGLIGARLQGASFYSVNLSRANLSGAGMHAAELEQVLLGRARLRGASMGKVRITDCDLAGANLEHAELSHSRLKNVSLTGANLRESQLSGVWLDHVDLSGADLKRAVLDPSQVAAVTYDTETVWPDGTTHDRPGVLNLGRIRDRYDYTGTDQSTLYDVLPRWFWETINMHCVVDCCGFDAYDLGRSSLRRRFGLNPEWAGPVGDRVSDDRSSSVAGEDLLDLIDRLRRDAGTDDGACLYLAELLSESSLGFGAAN